MKKNLRKLNRKQAVLIGTGVLSCMIGLTIHGIGGHMAGRLEDQKMAERWSADGDVSQISCFFSREAAMTEDNFISFEHGLDSALVEASIVNDSENEQARLWADAYSAPGRVSISSERATVEVSAIGVGGDFFLFHPLELLSGSYFSGSDLMQDHIVVDEDVAWQLFGSNDVDGQIVTIGGVPHIISGVIRREDSRMAKEAGLNTSVAYVSCSTLEELGTSYGVNTYELVMPNPVSGYAKTYVMEHIGASENEVEVVENTTRCGLLARFKLLARFGTRSMNSKAIIYPYWENIARGYEDILALLLVLTLLFLLYAAVLFAVLLIRAFKRKTWTAAGVWHVVKDKLERQREKVWALQKRRKAAREEKKNRKKEAVSERIEIKQKEGNEEEKNEKAD